jgi:predicted DNA-binding transcriptional regulator YafY
MRASRLVSLLLLLQTRGRMTAAQLAAELEVSERTIHRDVDALSAAGIPVFAERGPHGGVQLIDGYRTRLTGMTAEEAEALFFSGIPGPAAELGLGTLMAAARLKVLAALPPELRSRASRLVERFHLDAVGWFKGDEAVPHLSALAEAVWNNRVVQIGYARDGEVAERRLYPMGVVLKAGVWYLVAQVADADGQLRTYRVSRVREVVVSEERFQRPESFDLAAHWQEATTSYERGVPRLAVTLRVDPHHYGMLAELAGGQALREAEKLTPPGGEDPDGWHHLRLEMDWPMEVPARVLALADHAEVLEPAEVREEVLALAGRVAQRYATAGPPPPERGDSTAAPAAALRPRAPARPG